MTYEKRWDEKSSAGIRWEEVRWDEVWGVKSAVWSVGREEWSVKCEECSEKGREECSAKCGVWSVKCGLWSVKFRVRRVQCGVWSVKCGVLRVQCEVKSWLRRVQCEECSVKCEDCQVWSVTWSFKCDMWNKTPVWQSARTHELRWRTAHANSIDKKGLIYIFKATSARLVRVLLVLCYTILYYVSSCLVHVWFMFVPLVAGWPMMAPSRVLTAPFSSSIHIFPHQSPTERKNLGWKGLRFTEYTGPKCLP